MQPPAVKLVTVICEAALEPLIAPALLLSLGAKGYSICEARGRGNRGLQDARWSMSTNIRIEILCDADTARRILDTLFERYSANYGMVAWAVDVEVSRGFNF